jgi:Na+/proline symporter
VAARFVSGTSVTIAWNQVSFLKNIIYELVPAFFVSALLTVIISFLTTPPKNAEKELKSIAARHRR